MNTNPRETEILRLGWIRGHLSSFVVVVAVFLGWCFLNIPVLAGEPPKIDFGRYMEGKYLFERHCIVCHGARGDGTGELAPTLIPRPRSFREGMFKFRTTPFGSLPTDDDLRHTIKYGLSGTAMGMFGHLGDDEVTSLIVYVKSFSRRWRKEENYAEPLAFPEKPSWFQDEKAVAARALNGKALFATHCLACHGPAADGKGPAVATLKDVWNQPARPSDLRQPHLRSGDRPEDIYRTLATGLNGTPMVSFETIMKPEQRWEIIAWLQTIQLPAGPTLGGAPPREVAKAK